MKFKLKIIEKDAILAIKNVSNLQELYNLKSHLIGKKSKLNDILKGLSDLPKEEKNEVGKCANDIKKNIENEILNAKEKLNAIQLRGKLLFEEFDITVPGKVHRIGKPHLLTQVRREIEEIFLNMGFTIRCGPEIEEARYVFDSLNTPQYHPSRSVSDTFYINDQYVLRTHTSCVQIREMLTNEPPIAIIAAGRVFRKDELDATHSPAFCQIDGLVVDCGINMANLKYSIDIFLKKFFGNDTKIKFRPHNFPFTEPSAEVDILCFKCGGNGCSLCKNEGWIEILGCGMVHKNVLRNCNVNYDVYSGFAFGLGLERLAMLKYEIDDIRIFYENDLRFLEQF